MKNVLIVGGSRGIGEAMVRLFRKEGYNVAFTYKISAASATALERETGALAVRADSAVEAEIFSAVDMVEKTIGNVEILINNAAVWSSSLITDVSIDEWKNMFSVNVDAAFLYSKR